jgi:hypothetical protein
MLATNTIDDEPPIQRVDTNCQRLSEPTPSQMDDVMRLFYEVISFEEGQTPDWQCMQGLFSPHARITRVTPEGIDYMDLATFRNMAEEMLEVGAFTSF